MKIQTTSTEKKFFIVSFLIIIFSLLGISLFLKFLELKDLITILALIVGPISAVIITRNNDQLRARKERRLMTFRDLMKTRADLLPSPPKEFIDAFNLIPIDFSGEKNVQIAWKELFQKLHPNPQPKEQLELGQWFIDSKILTTKLLYEMGKCLDIEIDKLDILQNAYAPSGWTNERVTKDKILEHARIILEKQSTFINPTQNKPQSIDEAASAVDPKKTN